MAEFMLRQLHIDDNEVPKMCLDLYREYGTTMAGLKVKTETILVQILFNFLKKSSSNYSFYNSNKHIVTVTVFRLSAFTNLSFSFQALGYEFDNDEFHACVHGKLPYEALKLDLVLRNLLLSMPQRKIVSQSMTSYL